MERYARCTGVYDTCSIRICQLFTTVRVLGRILVWVYMILVRYEFVSYFKDRRYKITLLLFIVSVLLSVFYILKKGRITIKYSLVWIFSSLIILSNMIFAGLIAMLMFITLALTVIISGQNDKIRLLIQEVSILKGKYDEKNK